MKGVGSVVAVVRRAVAVLLVLVMVNALLIGTVVAAPARPVSGDTPAAIYASGENTCASPPSDFDPLTASDAELLRYGLPRHPANDGRDEVKWAEPLRHAKMRSCGPTIPGPKHIAPVQRPSGTTYSTSYNWAGYVATSHTYTLVEGKWTVPCYSPTVYHASALTWVGLGGYGNSSLWQGGTTEDETNGYKFWYEFLPDQPNIQKLSSPTPRCGDSIYAEADYGVNIANMAYVVLVDNTTGQYTSKTYGKRPSQASAEWIDERPSCGSNAFYPYEDVHTVRWTGADATAGSTNKVISGWPNVGLDMTDIYGSYTLATSSALGSGGNNFTDTWQFWGNDAAC